MKTLFILNGPPYGTERVYNGLRPLTPAEKKSRKGSYRLPHGGRGCKCQGRPKAPDGYYNVLCGTCMDARGFDDAALMAGARRSTMDELAAVTAEGLSPST